MPPAKHKGAEPPPPWLTPASFSILRREMMGATRGQWVVTGEHALTAEQAKADPYDRRQTVRVSVGVGAFCRKEDAAFVAHVLKCLPSLLMMAEGAGAKELENRRLKQENEDLHKQLRRLLPHRN